MMSYLQKVITAFGLEPSIASAVLIIVATLMVLITILYIWVPIFLFRMRKELIALNKTLRTLYILDKHTENTGQNESPSIEDRLIYDENFSKKITKLQLEDEDINKLKAVGFDIE